MFSSSPEMAKRIIEQRITKSLEEAETRRLLRQAGMDPRSPVFRQVRWLLSRLGHALVSLGRRLERYEVPSVAVRRNGCLPAKGSHRALETVFL